MGNKNDTIIVFDFDGTITNDHMHNYFSRMWKKDYNPALEKIVTVNDIHFEGENESKGEISSEEVKLFLEKEMKLFLERVKGVKFKEGESTADKIKSLFENRGDELTFTAENMILFLAELSPEQYNIDTVTTKDIKLALEEKGLKNEDEMKNVVRELGYVHVASFTSYPHASEYIIRNYLLEPKNTKSTEVKVIGGLPNRSCGKNYHILYFIQAHKMKYGKLPQKVILVDDDPTNIQLLVKFKNNTAELLKNNQINASQLKNVDKEVQKIEITESELKGIEFLGIKVPGTEITKSDKNVDNEYIVKLQIEFLNLNPGTLSQEEKSASNSIALHQENIKSNLSASRGLS